MKHQNFPHTLKIATRKSILALWQANFVKQQLMALYPSLKVELIETVTEGDKIIDVPLNKLGGKGLFVKALEEKLLDKTADIAVHSMKDMPAFLPDGLILGAILEREDPSDALVSIRYKNLNDLPEGAVVGTCSLRRQAQLIIHRPDLTLKMLRGNLDTRYKKLEQQEYDAIILATAGLKRLGWFDRIKATFSFDLMLPAVGQGALGIECRADDPTIQALIQPLHHLATAQCVFAERAMNAHLEGSCHTPIAGLAQIQASVENKGQTELVLHGLVATIDGKMVLKAMETGNPLEATMIGQTVAEKLYTQGANTIIKQYQSDV